MDTRLLTFGLGKRSFAIPLDCVVEATTLGGVEPIPRSIPTLLGVMAWREGVLPVVSLPDSLGITGVAPGRILLVVRLEGVVLGFPVERTGQIVPWPGEGEGLETVAGEGPILGRFPLRDTRCFILRLEKALASLLS